MTNLQKRILTSLVIFPLSFFFVVKGGYFLIFFLIFVLFAGIHELFSVFKKKTNILFLGLILILSLFSIYYLRNDHYYSVFHLYWVIILCICSDIGGYTFGKIFKGKKITKISPKKTISGVFGSFLFSLLWLGIAHELNSKVYFHTFFYSHLPDNFPGESGIWPVYFFSIKYFILTIIFSMIAQAGDLTISYLKRLEKIKDTGKILPGHGGIFDRIDGLMFVVILTFILYNLKFIGGHYTP